MLALALALRVQTQPSTTKAGTQKVTKAKSTKKQQNLRKSKGIGRDHAATSPGFEPRTILDRAYFPARVERVPQDVNQLGWQNLGQFPVAQVAFLENSGPDFVTATRVRRGRGGKV